MKKIIALFASLIALNANAEVINLVSVSNPPECRAGHSCEINSHHEIHIINTSSSIETLNCMYQLGLSGICDNVHRVATVYPTQHWNVAFDCKLRVRLEKGKFVYDVRTECGNEKSHHDYTIKV